MPVTVELRDSTVEAIKRGHEDAGTSSFAWKALDAVLDDIDTSSCPCGDPGNRDRRHFPPEDGRICTSLLRVDL